jgi:hypothetical protein
LPPPVHWVVPPGRGYTANGPIPPPPPPPLYSLRSCGAVRTACSWSPSLRVHVFSRPTAGIQDQCTQFNGVQPITGHHMAKLAVSTAGTHQRRQESFFGVPTIPGNFASWACLAGAGIKKTGRGGLPANKAWSQPTPHRPLPIRAGVVYAGCVAGRGAAHRGAAVSSRRVPCGRQFAY